MESSEPVEPMTLVVEHLQAAKVLIEEMPKKSLEFVGNPFLMMRQFVHIYDHVNECLILLGEKDAK